MTVVCDSSHFAFSSWARTCATCAYSPLVLPPSRCETCRSLAMACSSADRACASALRARVELAFQLLEIGLGLLEVEPVAGAGCTSSRFCSTRSRASSTLAETSRTRAIACSMALRASATCAAAPASCSSCSFEVPMALASCASSVLHLQLVGRRVDAEQHVALLHRAVGLDGHLDHAAAHLRDDVDHVLDDAHVGATTARRRSAPG